MTRLERKARTRDWLIIGFLAGLFVVAAVAAIAGLTAIKASNDTARLARENVRTTVGVCALRSDLQRRVVSSTKFLEEHPDGVAGISPRDIRAGIDNQQRTISALRPLKCP